MFKTTLCFASITFAGVGLSASHALATVDVYFTSDSSNTIRQGAAATIISNLVAGNPADIDVVGSTLYYTDFTTDLLYSVPTSGGSTTAFFDAGTAFSPSNPTIFSLALTPNGSTAYFGESITKGIYTVPTVGGSATKIVDLTALSNYSQHSTSTTPRGITIADDKIYWTDSLADVTARANLDGSGAEVILNNRSLTNDGNNSFTALTVDPVGGKIYYTDDTNDSIFSTNLDGTGGALFKALTGTLSGTFAPQDIEYFNGLLYVADTTQGVYTIDIATATVTSFFGTDLDIRGVAVAPEPGSLALLGLGAMVFLGRRRLA